MKYFYKDFITQKIHYTQAPFVGWTEPTGLLNARYAMFRRKWDIIFIPFYALTRETRAALPPMETKVIAESEVSA